MDPTITNYNTNQSINFTAFKPPKAEDLAALKKFVNCSLVGIESEFIDDVRRKSPKLISTVDGIEYIMPATLKDKLITGVKSFVGMVTLDPLDALARKFPGLPVNNWSVLKRYRDFLQVENEANALRGIYKNGAQYLEDAMKGKRGYPTGECGAYCHSICYPIGDKFNDALNATMSDYVGKYDTKKERFAARMMSGLPAAVLMGTDNYNKAIKKGKSEEEAKKAETKKRIQEVQENIAEGFLMFGISSCFSEQINKKMWLSAVVSAGVSIISRIVSRKMSGMPLTRIEAPETRFKSFMPTMKEYMSSADENNVKDLFDRKQQDKEKYIKDSNKKPYLTKKTIIGFCLASIGAGFMLRGMKNHTQIGKRIAAFFESQMDKFNAKTIEDVTASADNLNKMVSALVQAGEDSLADKIDAPLAAASNSVDGLVKLGTRYKTVSPFGIEIRTRDINPISLLMTPLKLMKELVSYPYKIANKALEAMNVIKSQKPANPITDEFEIKNIYLKFCEFQRKYPNDEMKAAEEFTKLIRKMRIPSNNSISSSKGDNSKIAVVAQLLGTLTGIGFNMNDEFNSSVRNGSTKKEAEKDARKRGINKFFRMSVQTIITGALNNIFIKQYNGSILGSASIVLLCTILTDKASRIMSGMPTKKVTKEEYDQYEKEHNEGFMRHYYKFIDKLAS